MILGLFSHTYLLSVYLLYSFPGGSVVKNPPTNEGDMGSVLGLRRSPGRGNGNPLQYSCLGNPMVQRSLVGHPLWGRKESDTTEVNEDTSFMSLS